MLRGFLFATIKFKEIITMATKEITIMATCPECEGALSIGTDVQSGEIVVCGDCGVDLEVLTVAPLQLALAPQEAEDWGE
jgi:alpha-aminoadipate/glutamate carrier protein LysW